MMIRYPAALLLCLVLFAIANSQPVYLKTILPHPLAVTDVQTTHVLFPCAIRSVDRGSADVLAQKVKGADFILQVKASTKAFAATNLSVVTVDGKFYSFALHYEEQPSVLNVSVENVSPDTWATIAARLRGLPAQFKARTNKDELHLRLRNLHIDSTNMWFTFRLRNFSAVGFDPGIQRFYVKERRHAKRTAVQEKELTPLYVDTIRYVGYLSPLVFTVAFPSFTIKRSQRFYVQLGERTGARLLTLPIKHRTLLKAKPLP